MKRLLILPVILLLCATVFFAQAPSGVFIAFGSGNPTGSCTTGQTYTDTAAGNNWTCLASVWVGPHGASVAAYLTSLYTNATTTFSSVTGLSFAVAASTNYKVTCDLDYQVSATTLDVKIQWTGPASPTFLVYDLDTAVTGSTLSASVNPATATTTGAFSTALSEAGTPTATTNFPLRTTMTLINGANAGTIQLQAAATASGTVSILPGSCSIQR